jgi:hypothetical protein
MLLDYSPESFEALWYQSLQQASVERNRRSQGL